MTEQLSTAQHMLCNRNQHSVTGKLHFKDKEIYRKRDPICDYQRQGWELGQEELDEAGQKVQTPNCKINKYQGYDVLFGV